MNKQKLFFTLFTTIALSTAPLLVSAQELIIYPAKGQDNETLEKDKFECYSWAKNQTGFDPMKVPTTSTPPPSNQQQSGGVVRGAARGALAGLAIGAVAGDSRKGAEIGAAAGGIKGGVSQRRNNTQNQQNRENWERQEAQKYQQERGQYDRAYSACLEGRGYTVK